MKKSILLGSFLAVFLFRFSASAIPQTTAFSYQGRLNTAGTPVTGIYDFQFTLYTAASGPSSVGSPQTISTVPVTNGLFSITLDFGAGIFTGSQRWLEIGVRTNNASSFTLLPQRQPILSTPYAITAANLSGNLPAAQLVGNLPATQLSGVLPSAQLSGTYSGAVSFTNIANSFSGSGNGLTNIELAGLNSHGGLSLASNTAFFGLYGTLSVGIAPVGVTAADLNFDGTNDLISADFGAGTLSVMLGHGDGTFASPSTINVGNGPDFVAVADFNGDGTNDLATANYNDNTLTILIGVGDGTFNVLGSPVPVGAEPYSLAVADVNHDGRMDIISANYLFSSSTVTVLFGQGDGTFVEAPGSPYAVGSGPTGVVAVDLDG
ncbi:MAG: repeat protein, partial [Verrucomicrobiales bacterium]|nr:repeat protein [Verrucomicrobiales bacterium]